MALFDESTEILAGVRREIMQRFSTDAEFHHRVELAVSLATTAYVHEATYEPATRRAMAHAAAWALALTDDTGLAEIIGRAQAMARSKYDRLALLMPLAVDPLVWGACDVRVDGKPCARPDPHGENDMHHTAPWGT